ncbi:hypothetical protein L4D76_23760 [Photobacterium sagamiensis]
MELKAVAIVLAAALVAPQALAKPARSIGKIYAQAVMCSALRDKWL